MIYTTAVNLAPVKLNLPPYNTTYVAASVRVKIGSVVKIYNATLVNTVEYTEQEEIDGVIPDRPDGKPGEAGDIKIQGYISASTIPLSEGDGAYYIQFASETDTNGVSTEVLRKIAVSKVTSSGSLEL